jgi:hypothetical protein
MFDPGVERKFPYLMGYLRHLTQRTWIPTMINWGLVLGAIGAGVAIWGGISHQVTTIAAGVFALAVGGYFAVRFRRNQATNAVEDPRTERARRVAHLMVSLSQHKRLHRDLDEGSLLMMEEAARGWTRAHAALDTGAWVDPYRINTLAGLRERLRNAADAGMADIMGLYQPYLPPEAQPRAWTDYASEFVESFVKTRTPTRATIPSIFWDANEVADKLCRLAEEAERISLHGDPQAQPIPGQAIDHVLGEIKVRSVAETELDAQQIKLN